ncbi:MAG: hypothetical protein Q9198_002448 [Flavoplaca austrocitrina]
MDEHFNPAPEAPLPPPQVPIIEPRRTERRRSPERKKKPQKFYDDIKMVFDFHIPFTSHSRKTAKKPRKESRPANARDRPITPAYPAAPPKFGNPQPLMGAYPGPGMIPIPPPAPPRGPAAPTPPIIVHSISSTDSSPSPISPLREHHRPRARSLSLNRQYDKHKEAMREHERRKHVERVAFTENTKRLRAEREAQRLREEVDRERRHKEDLRIRAQRLLDDQRRLQIEDANRQRRQSQERVAAAIVARRRRRELDRRREAEAIVEAERRVADRRRREEEVIQERMQEERDRLTRQRLARIPRGPRHAAVLHHHHHHHYERENNDFQQRAREEFEGRGDWVLNQAMRAEQSRPVGRGAPQDLQPRWPRANGLRRRGTIAAGERRVYDDDFRRGGRRWF